MSRWFGSTAPEPGDDPLQHAAWVARCVGRGSVLTLGTVELESLADDLEPVEFGRGDAVFLAGRRPEAVWIVRSGSVGLFAGAAPDRVILSVLRPGDLDGDLGILMDMPSPYAGEALEDTVCLRFGAVEFDRLFTSHPALARRWLTAIAARLASSQQRLVDLLGAPLAQQVARVLLDEAVNDELPYSQATIAALLGARRPSVNKALKDLQHRRLIEVGYRTIEILDHAGLVAASGRLEEAPGR